MKPILFANGLILNDGFRFIGTVLVANGMIEQVGCHRIDLRDVDTENYRIVDCEGKMVLPGAIDEHVHFRQPGMTEKGDIASESRAAVAGGVTSFFDMPNTNPATTSIENWEEKTRMAAGVSAANYAFFIGATNSNIDQLLEADPTRVPGVKLFLGSSTGNMLVDDDSTISRLFNNYKGVIACHAESEKIIAENRRALTERFPDGIPVGCHHLLRSREACLEASRHAVEMARKTGARLHLLHISTADELSLLSPGPVVNKRITAETCPHYLLFNHESVEQTAALTKCNPAIKTDDDRRALITAVREGKIDVLASDHAPHLLQQKQGDLLKAASGMPSVQFTLPLALQLARKGCFTYEKVVERMCNNPALLFNIDRRGFIRNNYWADLTIIDPDADYEITDAEVLSACGWTPYAGQRLNFRVDQTWVNGALAYDRSLPHPFPEAQTALPIRFSPA
ncbi:MAG: dihydroorotase [Firmicutes bacterium]|nr:dihydroorotase [Bacillota bacterium]